ncbi:YlxR family protein [Homoserinibacter sp. YIM 151385]|uniref:YlxR family protein n=1 Tax=Homoserinibacter sp. YIM 151385 TaxID=2985506 RepID=UPI0022EFFCC9|nr:YlxR family protein [Homoserinibacter sp. YIM 151385]WBU38330.1 YlxR family protein [Homoserinibacter sp. YIM 151385]
MGPLRTCLGCRQRAPRDSLLRVVARGDRVVADAAARLPGRGAWVHPSLGCIENAVRRKALGRALRTTVTDTSDLKEQAERLMDK